MLGSPFRRFGMAWVDRRGDPRACALAAPCPRSRSPVGWGFSFLRSRLSWGFRSSPFVARWLRPLAYVFAGVMVVGDDAPGSIDAMTEGRAVGGFEFWRRWLEVASWALAAFGLALAFFNQTAPFDLAFNDRIDPAFWPAGAVPSEARTFQQWAYGVLGSVLSGWAVFMAFLARHAFPLKQAWAWRCFVLGTGLWFAVDTALSLYFGVRFNALFNVLLLVALGIPLVSTRKHFGA